MKASVVYVGMDVHKDSITMAVAREGREPAEAWKTIPNDGVRLRKALRMLTRDGGVLRVCYEAGPTGFGLYRRLREAGIDCIVVAPSLVPGKPGDRVKTDRRDARKLAHFLRSGDLTEVYVPDEAVEAIRDLERSRDGAKRAERVARHQLSKFLLRQDRRWEGTTWTLKHRDWIRVQKFAYPAQQRVLEDYLKTVEDVAERVQRLTALLKALVEETVLAPLVKALQAFRGVSVVSAVTIAAEVGDLRRFATAGQFMSYVGLVPSEDSTGQRRRQGRITRCGNGHLRRILVEAAWHYRHQPVMSKELRRRNQGVAPGVRRIAWEAQKRLNKRLYHLIHAGKSSQKAVIALARELAGFVWAVGQEDELLETP
ncbi:MAG: IS110 family transposase [Pirellulales bacterium]